VRTALSQVISARAAFVQAQAGLRSSVVNVQATQARYKVGAATVTDIVTAQSLFATASSTYVNALYAERIAEERYTFALGASDLKL
jgi:outer membrane protein TolC